MRPFVELLREERGVRRLAAAHAQSMLGTGAGYVALLIIAYDRFHSAWAVSAVLLCELLPAMLLGAVIGAAGDRWSRKKLLVAGDVLRAAAFIGLAFVSSIEATIALALLAGFGQAVFVPTMNAALPSVVSKQRLPQATALYGALEDIGYTAGPALAALAYVLIDAQGVLLANGLSFALSAVVIGSVAFRAPARAEVEGSAPRPGLLASAREGIRVLAAHQGARSLVLASAAFVAFLGAVNVGELLLVRDTLDGSGAQYALVVAAMGSGIAVGSLVASRGDTAPAAQRLYLLGLLACAAAMAACGLAPTYGLVLVAFAALGFGNGLVAVSENLLIQHVIPDEVLGRIFGLKNAVLAWAGGAAYLGGAAIASLVGPRPLFLFMGAGSLLVWGLARTAMRGAWAPTLSGRKLPAAPVPAAAVPVTS